MDMEKLAANGFKMRVKRLIFEIENKLKKEEYIENSDYIHEKLNEITELINTIEKISC